MESAHELLRMKGCDNLAKDYLDTLILRLIVITMLINDYEYRMVLINGSEIISQ